MLTLSQIKSSFLLQWLFWPDKKKNTMKWNEKKNPAIYGRDDTSVYQV